MTLVLKRMQAMRWQVAATETLLYSCGTRSKIQRRKRKKTRPNKNTRRSNDIQRQHFKNKSEETKIHKIDLTRLSAFKLLLTCMAAAIDFAPSSPIRLLYCIAHVTPDALRDKRNDDRAILKMVKFISQGSDPASCCSLPRLTQSIEHRGRRFR